MRNPLPEVQPKRYFAWGVGISQFFPTYEEAWRFAQKVKANTGRIVSIEPVYAV